VAILIAAFLLGAQALALTCLRRETALPVPERSLFALGLGIVLMAYVLLAVGLLGFLTRPVVLVAALACGLVGLRQVRLLAEALRVLLGAVRRGLLGPTTRRAVHAFLVVWTLLVLLGTLAPPGDSDWDGLSQHLATPKIYLRHHAIAPIWFDHHSNFPFTLQMLFTVAMAAGSPEAAKVIHLVCGIAAALALIVAGRRFLSPAAGVWAAFALVTVPLVGWLGTVAYVDLGGAFFAALTVLGFLLWDRTRASAHLVLAALAAGGGLAVKMQGIQLLPLAALCVVAAGWRARAGAGRLLRDAALFLAIGGGLAAPWYIKSAVWTGNPVYPFAYGVFGGKYWSKAQAATYQEHQSGFGVGRLPPAAERARMGFLARTLSGPRAPVNLLLAPWNLVMRPGEFEVAGFSPIAGSVGPLFLALLPLLLLGRPPRPVVWCLAFVAPLWLGWLLLMQYGRYLAPALAVAALPVGYVLADSFPSSGLARAVPRVVAWAWGVVALTYVGLIAVGSGAWRASLGQVDRSEYLEATCECFRVAEFVNARTPPDAKVALYSEPRGFYLDREYLWAESGHSTLIDYAGIRSGDDLRREFRRLGITHLLYRELGRTGPVLSLPQIGEPLKELHRRGLVQLLGSPPADPSYTLLAIDTREHPRRGSQPTLRPVAQP